MKEERLCFENYLRRLGLCSESTEVSFDMYYNELVQANQKINLFSRKMRIDEVWTKHFLDSVSIFEVYKDFSNKSVLDFGTGGGLPGIPIKILCPECKMTFLDGTKKKIDELKRIVSKMKLDNVSFLSNRLEDREMDIYKEYFDIVVCRSVKMTETLLKAILKVLKKGGNVFFYKAVKIDDVLTSLPLLDRIYNVETRVYPLDIKILGQRRIIKLSLLTTKQ